MFPAGGGGRGKAEEQKENWGGDFLPSKWSEMGKISDRIEHMASPGSWLQLRVSFRKDMVFF